MVSQKNRYFIELQPDTTAPVPRYQETENRRKLATQFIEIIGDWLKKQDLDDKVSAMAITALGQVQITCEADVITQIRSQDIMEIAAVRQGSMLSESLSRWSALGT